MLGMDGEEIVSFWCVVEIDYKIRCVGIFEFLIFYYFWDINERCNIVVMII